MHAMHASLKKKKKLTGRQPPKMSPAIENKLKLRFRQIQAPFEKYRDELLPERKNFLSYVRNAVVDFSAYAVLCFNPVLSSSLLL